MKDSPATVQVYSDAGTFSFADGCAARYEKRFNVAPFDVARERIGIDGGKKGTVFSSKRLQATSFMVS